MSTFLHVPADRFLAKLDEIGQKIATKGGRYTKEDTKKGSEIVYEIALPPSPNRAEFIVMKVYTSIAVGSSEARPVGEDAIRVLVGSISTGDFKKLREPATVKRTAPNDVEDRVGAFLERLTETLRKQYKFALSVPICPSCGHHMAERDGKKGKFWGCTSYPNCARTKSM